VLENSPANENSGECLGIESRTYNDPAYEKIFAAHNSSANEIEQREGYNPHKAWPFHLQPIDVSQTAGTPQGYFCREDPRYYGYPIAWAHSVLDAVLRKWRLVKL